MLSAADIASMTATVAASFDTTVTVKRKGAGQDAYGHANGTYTSVGSTADVNVYKPSSSTLQAFAGIIGSQKAAMIRFALTTDIREDDQIVLNGETWLVQDVEVNDSYTFSNNALIVLVS